MALFWQFAVCSTFIVVDLFLHPLVRHCSVQTPFINYHPLIHHHWLSHLLLITFLVHIPICSPRVVCLVPDSCVRFDPSNLIILQSCLVQSCFEPPVLFYFPCLFFLSSSVNLPRPSLCFRPSFSSLISSSCSSHFALISVQFLCCPSPLPGACCSPAVWALHSALPFKESDFQHSIAFCSLLDCLSV